MVRILDRLLLFIYSFVIGAFSIYLLFTASAWLKIDLTERVVNRIYYDKAVAYPLIVISLAFLLISLRFLYISLRRDHGNAPSIDQRTDYGEIRISLETVENLALKAAARTRAIKDVRARISVSQAGLEIVLRAIVDGETPIPTLTEDVQSTVKDYIEEITGIPVAVISVFVANVIQSPHTFKSRVE